MGGLLVLGAAQYFSPSVASIVMETRGMKVENATLQVILSTLALNFPEIETCSLLVDGAQVETLGGHIQADQPFALRRWR